MIRNMFAIAQGIHKIYRPDVIVLRPVLRQSLFRFAVICFSHLRFSFWLRHRAVFDESRVLSALMPTCIQSLKGPSCVELLQCTLDDGPALFDCIAFPLGPRDDRRDAPLRPD
jgi:hypothetical protein